MKRFPGLAPAGLAEPPFPLHLAGMQISGTASRREPALNIPAPLLFWLALLALIHGGRELLPAGGDPRVLLDGGFIPASWSIALGFATPQDVVASVEAGAGSTGHELRQVLARFVVGEAPRPWSPVTYSLLHGSWTHLGFNALMLVAFGSSVVRRSGALASLALWLATAIGGAAGQWLLDPKSVDVMIGASASAFGFMAAAATFAFAAPGEGRWDFLRNRGALSLLALWLVGNLAAGLVLDPLGWTDGEVAWAAHIGGLVIGLVLYPLLQARAARFA